jgi:hypothetical protein
MVMPLEMANLFNYFSSSPGPLGTVLDFVTLAAERARLYDRLDMPALQSL